MGKLERLVKVLIGGRYASAADLWRLQTQLLELQQTIQQGIGALKAVGRLGAEERQQLDSLRSLRWHARRFGDALAWLLLGLDRKLIFPLADNDPVPIPPDDDHTRVTVSIVEAMSSEGWGFPLLHDITDCLRIGDVTFIEPNVSRTTVELKATIVSEQSKDDGSRVQQVEATMISMDEPPQRVIEGRPTTDEPPPSLPARRHHSPRVERQLNRLSRAKARQSAQPNEMTEVDGDRLLTVVHESKSVESTGAIARAARRARRSGTGTQEVDGSILYVAIFDPEGIDIVERPEILERLPEAVTGSDILFPPPDEARNSIVVYSLLDDRYRPAQRFLPYFLLDLPKTTILDLLRGRMMIFALVNPGRIAAVLEDAGFRFNALSDKQDLSASSYSVSTEVTTPSGARFGADLRSLELHVLEMVMEGRSVQYLVETAESMRRGVECVLALDEQSGRLGKVS